jgi:hypothetical protein
LHHGADYSGNMTISRRAALKAIGTSAGALTVLPWLSDEGLAAFQAIQRTKAASAPKLLSRAQYATLEAFVEALIPADDRSPGAKDARVADYLDLLLSEADDTVKQRWFDGLAALDAEAGTQFQAPFAKLTAPQVEKLLTEISRNERTPQTPVESFFTMTKNAAIHGYYTSEIGIHKELRYKGNQFIAEFVGCEPKTARIAPIADRKYAPERKNEERRRNNEKPERKVGRPIDRAHYSFCVLRFSFQASWTQLSTSI